MLEVKKEYQDILTYPADIMVGKIKVYNENFFKNLDNVTLDWELVADGNVIKKGTVASLQVAPHDSVLVDLHYSLPRVGYKEIFLNVYYKTKSVEALCQRAGK
jgi:beta-galactosidase